MSLWNVLDAFGVKQERRSFWEHAKLFCSPFRNKDPSITMEGSQESKEKEKTKDRKDSKGKENGE